MSSNAHQYNGRRLREPPSHSTAVECAGAAQVFSPEPWHSVPGARWPLKLITGVPLITPVIRLLTVQVRETWYSRTISCFTVIFHGMRSCRQLFLATYGPRTCVVQDSQCGVVSRGEAWILGTSCCPTPHWPSRQPFEIRGDLDGVGPVGAGEEFPTSRSSLRREPSTCRPIQATVGPIRGLISYQRLVRPVGRPE